MNCAGLNSLRRCAIQQVLKQGFKNKKRSQNRKEVNTKMELNTQTQKTNGNGHLVKTRKSQSTKTGSIHEVHHSIFDPMKYMLKLPKTKKVILPNGQEGWQKTEAEYLPVAARIAWFRKDHPYWSIITKVEKWGDKAVVMKAIIKDMSGVVLQRLGKKRQKLAFRITSKKPRQAQSVGL
jgi:hypothetical protein